MVRRDTGPALRRGWEHELSHIPVANVAGQKTLVVTHLKQIKRMQNQFRVAAMRVDIPPAEGSRSRDLRRARDHVKRLEFQTPTRLATIRGCRRV